MRRVSRALILAATLIFASVSGPQAQTDKAQPGVTATVAAQSALTSGNIGMARLLALAALQENSKDPDALAVLSAIALAGRQSREAGQVALEAWSAAETRNQRFASARLVARAAYDLKAHEYSKRWLRRAVQFAPDDALRDATIRDFLKVRAESPVTLSFRLSVSPSDNLNQGARDPMLVIDGRPTYFVFDGGTMALSGVEANLSAGLRYRLGGDASAQTDLILRLRHRSVALSQEAKALAPTIRAKDLATWDIEAGVERSRRLTQTTILRFGGDISQNWLGGSPYALALRGHADLTRRLSAQSQLRLGFSAEHQIKRGQAAAATALTLDSGWDHRLASGDRLGLRLELGATASSDNNQQNARVSGEIRYIRGEPVAGARLSAAIGLSFRDYPVFFNNIFSTSGRQDRTLSAALDIALPALGAYGFEPVVTLKGSRTQSNISRYDTWALGLGISLQSSF